jgi:hypothetical protein
MNYKNFFLTENKSGYKSKEIFLKNNHPDLYLKIIKFCEKELNHIPFTQKIWHFINNVNTIPQCKNCKKYLSFKKSLSEGYGGYCSMSCTNKSEEHKNNVKITNNIKYGGNSPISSPIVFNKIKKTINDRYSVDNIFKNIDYISEKTFNKYCVTNISK